jgi:preprotein translocase SecE subunit
VFRPFTAVSTATDRNRIMSTAIYKKGQGFWTRQMSTVAGSVLTLLGAIWFSDQFRGSEWFGLQPIYWRAISGLVWCAIFGALMYSFIWVKPRTVDFLVATETEMKKVNWSTRHEIFGSTVVVILLAAGIAGFCRVCDYLFLLLFSSIGVLDT